MLKNLHIINYRNIQQADLEMCGGINCFVGANGAGKTNLLDAVYYLSFTKSAFCLVDSQNIYHGEPFFVLQGTYNIDNDEHIKLTGKPNENIKDCLRYLSDIGTPVWVRHVLVPGITDNDEYLKKTRDFIDTLSNVKRIDVLPYHSLGQFKWEELGIPYQLQGVEPPSAERIENAKRILGAN